MRIKHTVNIIASEDTAQERVLFGQTDTSLNAQTLDGFERIASGRLSIVAGATEVIPMGDVADPRCFYLCADGNFQAKFGSTGVDWVDVKQADSSTGRKTTMFIEADVNQVSIKNPSGTATITGTYVVWGDVTP